MPRAAPLIDPQVHARIEAVRQLCAEDRAAELELFGSAGTGRFDPASSEPDFLVPSEPMSPEQPSHACFGLPLGLEDLLGRPIELITERSIRNPCFLRSIEAERTVLYGAAERAGARTNSTQRGPSAPSCSIHVSPPRVSSRMSVPSFVWSCHRDTSFESQGCGALQAPRTAAARVIAAWACQC